MRLKYLFLSFFFAKYIAMSQVGGFEEVVISVYNLEKSVEFWQKVGGYEVKFKSHDLKLKNWNNYAFDEVFMGNAGDETGYLRLVKFKNTEQKVIRSGAKTWDAGGIFDVDIRVLDIDRKFEQAEQFGWHVASSPVLYDFGQFKVVEGLLKGPDAVVIAAIQRIAPPLTGWPHLKEFSHQFNSTQIVQNMDAALDFYVKKLGWKVYMQSNTPGENHDNVLGVPNNLNPQTMHKVSIVHPEGKNMGSVELIQIEGITGKSYAQNATPPNLGILTLRFPVQNMDDFSKMINEKGVAIEKQPTEALIKPYGRVKIMVLRAPDGAWLEFFEKIN